MKTLMLLPYSPWPSNSGACVEMLKHIDAAHHIGHLEILSAQSRPVGLPWPQKSIEHLRRLGVSLVLREQQNSMTFKQLFGLTYGAICKFFHLEQAFCHSNPYHRHAFPEAWWLKRSLAADLAIIHYSYWAHLPCSCPKVVVLHDFLSDRTWGDPNTEAADLCQADMVIVISKEEEIKLHERGVLKTHWSPPAVSKCRFVDSDQVGIVGSDNFNNREGLRWLSQAFDKRNHTINVYGGLAAFSIPFNGFEAKGLYRDWYDPYRENGIILLPTAHGTGVQIKGVEAIATGRAIIARKGAMRGLPSGEGAWIEVDSPDEMQEWTKFLISDKVFRQKLSSIAEEYYSKYLDSNKIKSDLQNCYLNLARGH